jgi:DNA-binding transcriptional MocR family regulator
MLAPVSNPMQMLRRGLVRWIEPFSNRLLDHWSIVSKTVSSFELVLNSRQPHQTLTNWLYRELCSAILDGRLNAGSRLPGSRDFAAQYGISRGTVVNVFERLQAEGYVSSRSRGPAPLPASLPKKLQVSPLHPSALFGYISGMLPQNTVPTSDHHRSTSSFHPQSEETHKLLPPAHVS